MPIDIPGAPSFPKFQTVTPSTFHVFIQFLISLVSSNNCAVDLVEADAFKLATEVDTLWTDTKDAFLLEATLCIDGADGHCGRQSGGHGNCHDVKNT